MKLNRGEGVTRVRIDIFSGRENPVIYLQPDEAQAFLSPFTKAVKEPLRTRQGATRAFSRLGYRGLIIDRDRASTGLPSSFRVFAGTAYSDTAFWAAPGRTKVDELRLLGRIRPQVNALVAEAMYARGVKTVPKIRSRVRTLSSAFTPPGPTMTTLQEDGVQGNREGRMFYCNAPFWDLDWWYSQPRLLASNNCYNYACAFRTDTLAQPGRAANAQYSAFTAGELIRAAQADALEVQADQVPVPVPETGHLVAVMLGRIGNQDDFHFLRLDRDGRWTHKPGQGYVTALDDNDQWILDPRAAYFAYYNEFVGFMVVKMGRVKIW